MNMGLKKRLLFLPILVVVLAGCSTLTHSPIVFTSRQTIGVDIRPTASDTTRPGVSIGIRNSDFAWVPAVGIGLCLKWKKDEIAKMTPADWNFTSKDWQNKCETQAFAPKPLLAHSKSTENVFSVYGQFDANVGGFGGSDGQQLAKVFAVGLAAQMYTKASSARVRNECLQAVEKFVQEKIAESTNGDIKDGREQITVFLKQQCGATTLEEKK